MTIRSVTAFFLTASVFLTLGVSVAFGADSAVALPRGQFTGMKDAGQGVVKTVIDPLTVQLEDGRIVRLAGLYYPDLFRDEPGDLSVASLRILRDMLEGERVSLYQTQSADLGRLNRMGHHLAHIVRESDQAWVQGTILSLGLALTETTRRNRDMAAQMLTQEERARQVSIGLWDQDARVMDILTPEQAPEHVGSFQIVEGTVVSASMNKNRVYLNFGPDWRSDFTVSIESADRRLFSKEGLDPLQWNGARLRVRGWVGNYNGPYIEATHPEAIEVIEAKGPMGGASVEALPAADSEPMVKTISNNN